MLTITAAQMAHMTRMSFFERVYRFVDENALREDWKAWMQDRRRLEDLWSSVWRHAQQHTEHDCALFLVLLAIRAFEGEPVVNPQALLGQIASREVSLKNYIAGCGYLLFSAFDYPVGSIDKGKADA